MVQDVAYGRHRAHAVYPGVYSRSIGLDPLYKRNLNLLGLKTKS